MRSREPVRSPRRERRGVDVKAEICPASCRDVLDDVACGCSFVGVCPATLVRIAPGGVYDSAWSGAVQGMTTLPDACVPDECWFTDCQVASQAPAGTYTLGSRHSKSIPCGPDCLCDA